MREAQQRREKKMQAMEKAPVDLSASSTNERSQEQVVPSRPATSSSSSSSKSIQDAASDGEESESEEEQEIVKPRAKKQVKAAVDRRSGNSGSKRNSSSSNNSSKNKKNVWQLIEDQIGHEPTGHDDTAKAAAPKQQRRGMRASDTERRGRDGERAPNPPSIAPTQTGEDATSEPKKLSFMERLKQTPLDALQPTRKPSTASSSASTTSAISGATSTADSASTTSRSVAAATASSSSSSSSSAASFRPSRYSSSDSLMSPSITSPAAATAPSQQQRGPIVAVDTNKSIVERNINRKMIYTELFNSLLKR